MLVELSLRDLVLFERLELTLGPGLNAVTGETGAGKSLLVGALELLRGEVPRGGAARWVRKGAEEARVEGRFVLKDPGAIEEVRACLAAELPSIAEDWEAGPQAEIILGRSLSREGRTRAHVNQRPVALKALKALAPLLLEIHGQNEHQRLLAPAEQLRLLDAYGGLSGSTGPLLRYRAVRDVWLEVVSRRDRLTAEAGERRDRIELLRFQRSELESAELEEGEHARLGEERELLRAAGDLRVDLVRWIRELTGEDASALDRVRAANRSLGRWREKLGRLNGPVEELTSAEVHLEEAATALTSILAEVTHDPARLEIVEERLSELERLEHKYRLDEGGLLALLGSLGDELQELVRSEESLDSVENERGAAFAKVEAVAAELRKQRKALAPKLAKAVEKTLGALGLARASFGVQFAEQEPGPSGTDQVEFLLAANPGEERQPLRKVVSGGEAARIMLAVRTVFRAAGPVANTGRVLVFDEIDSGVGGRLGPEVGAHLRKLAERDQVLCVTHIPAIAALAHVHLTTTKEVRAGRTRTNVVPVDGEARVAEIADMIAGGSAHSSARAEARRLLQYS